MYTIWLVYGLGHAGKEQIKCIPNYWRCLDNRKCIAESSRCNGIFDCQDHSDEHNCNRPSENLEGNKQLASILFITSISTLFSFNKFVSISEIFH